MNWKELTLHPTEAEIEIISNQKKEQVEAALKSNGFIIEANHYDSDWVAFVARKPC